MTVRILLDGPSRPAGPRLARVLAILAGLLLIGVGVVGVYGVILIAILFIGSSSTTAADQRTAALIAVVCGAVAFGGLRLGLRLLRGRRRLVLFLRRFGFDDATRAVNFAAIRAIGRSWRLVTLDDEKVKAVGGPAAQRRLAVVTAALALVLLIYMVWSWLNLPNPDSLTHKFMASRVPCRPTGIACSLNNGINGLAAEFAYTLAAMAAAFAVLVWGTVAGVSTLLLVMTYRFARRAEHAKAVRIQSQQDVHDRSQAIMRRASRIFAPRLVVATVADQVWQQAVHSFGRAAAAVIIDVSVPSENLRWEINTLLPIMGRRCVLVGRLDLLTAQGQGGGTAFASPLARDIDGHDVLVYRPDKSGVRRFSRALKATIEARTHAR